MEKLMLQKFSLNISEIQLLNLLKMNKNSYLNLLLLKFQSRIK